MTRYFFDIHDGDIFIRDDDGTECADFEQARVEAMQALPEIARFAISKGGDNQGFIVFVRDDGGSFVYSATLTFAGLRLSAEAANAVGDKRL